MIVLLMAVFLVFTVLLLEFGSFAEPLAIVFGAVLAMFGTVLALWITSTSLNVVSLLGAIIGVGIVAKNGILMLDFAKTLRSQGMDVAEALVRSGRRRLRPVLMTSMAAALGMLPLAYGIGSGADMLKPLAIAVIGALCISVLLSLIATPTIYYLMTRRRRDGLSRARRYFPNSRTMNEPGTTVGRGRGCSAVGAGAGPYSAVTTKTWWVLGSSSMVRAPRAVGTVSTTVYLSADSCLTTVNVPSAVRGEDESGPGIVADRVGAASDRDRRDDLPVLEVRHDHDLVADAEEALVLEIDGQAARAFAGRDRPARLDLERLGVEGDDLALVLVVDEDRALPVRERRTPACRRCRSVPTTLSVAASMAVALAVEPLKVKTRSEKASYMMASGFWPDDGTSARTLSVLRSKTETLLPRPLEM